MNNESISEEHDEALAMNVKIEGTKTYIKDMNLDSLKQFLGFFRRKH